VRVLGALVLVALTFGAFGRVAGNDFVHLDDPTYVVENPRVTAGLTGEGVAWAFTTGHASNWHPLTWLSHMLDCELFGLEPAGHHLMNVGFHALAAALLFLALCAMTREVGPSLFVAALFALHPLRVESVAWTAERKDVLSGVFWMLTILAYAGYARRPGAVRYAGLVLAFALGLMAKSMLVTLPFVLLLLDVWPLGRWRLGRGETAGTGVPLSRLLLEKAPLLALAIAAGVVTVISQRAGGAIGMLETISLGARGANALVTGAAYLWMTVWPMGLACFYPHAAIVRPGELAALGVPAIAAGAFLALVTALVVRGRARRPYALVGWLWYLGTLLPVIGLLQVGMQARADRYTYLPIIGVYLVAVWGFRDLVRARPRLRPFLRAAAVLVLAGCAIGTWVQIGHWRSSEALFSRAVEVTERNYMAHLNLGAALAERGEEDEAMRHYELSLEFHPPNPFAHNNLGSVLVLRGREPEAIEHFAEAIRLRPNLVDAYVNLGMVLSRTGEYARAREALERGLRLDPDHPEGHNELGFALENLSEPDLALEHYREAIRLSPGLLEARKNAAILLIERGELGPGRIELEAVLALAPEDGDALHNLGITLHRLGDLRGAVARYREKLTAGLTSPSTLNNLAWILATCPDPELRDGEEALRLAEECARLSSGENPRHLRTLAAAHAATGAFEAAIEWQAMAIDLAPEEWKGELEEDLQRFRDGESLRK